MTSFLTIVRRCLSWTDNILRHRVITYGIIAVIAFYGVALRTVGLGRSLWIDEAWEANAIIAPSISTMFYHSSWLPTCLPPFLLLVRGAVGMFGLTSPVLRTVPCLMGLLACVSMVALAVRLLSRRYALLASALFVLCPVATEFSRTLKQYTSELAATTTILLCAIVYLERATPRRFWLLAGAVIIGLLIAYPVVFLLPGIVLVVFVSPVCSDSSVFGSNRPFFGSYARAIILTTLTGGILIGEYLLFILPNLSSSAQFRKTWAAHNGTSGVVSVFALHSYGLLRYLPIPHRIMQRTELVGVAVGALLVAGFALAWLRFRKGRRIWLEVQVISLVPCLLLLIADWLGQYPMVARTGLFLLPFVVVLLACSLQLTSEFLVDKVRRGWLKPLLNVALVCVTLLVVRDGIISNSFERVRTPYEDIAGAVSFLRENVQSSDILWVNSSASEGFKFYARMTGWNNAPVRFGDTGWACCARGVPEIKTIGSENAVRTDLSGGIPGDFSGKVWLLYTERFEHWQILGLYEPQTMKTFLGERGCSETSTPLFKNMGVSSFDCRKSDQ